MTLRTLLLSSVLIAAAQAAEPGEAGELRTLVDHLRDLEAQVALIERESALPVDRAALWAGATRGLVEAADPLGTYLSAADVAIHGLGSDAQRVALGFDWRRDEAGVLITRVVPASPAAVAGIHPGCRILTVDGMAIAGASRSAIANGLARGQDRKRLRIQPVDGDVVEVEITRQELSDDGIAHIAFVMPGIMQVRIGRFLPATAPDESHTVTAAAVRTAIGARPLRAVIMDLRGCAGGNLQAAVEVAACWLGPDVPIIEQTGRNPSRSRVYAAGAPQLTDAPVVVLVDTDTASSAEVLAQALHRTRRAPLVGVPTHGKWSVQQLFLLPGGDAMTLTVANLRAPGGELSNGPLIPDVQLPQDSRTTWQRWRAELAGRPDLPPDPQLDRAVELARTLAMTAGR
jgi:carboxyl-terminal processing protease